MKKNEYHFDWGDLAFGSKSQVNRLQAIFVPAPRQLSNERLKQLIKLYLPQGNLIFGIAKEPYVLGFEGQPQFKTLQINDIQPLLETVNARSEKHKIYLLEYAQAELKYIFAQLTIKKVALISGSWKYTFHTQAPFYELVKKRIGYEMLSPFVSEQAAQDYAAAAMNQLQKSFPMPASGTTQTETGMLAIAETISRHSFDYSFQTGVSLGKKVKSGQYAFLAATYNKVVPYQAYAMHHGASRETNLSPPHDLNHYDTVHAEVELIIKAQKEKIDLSGTTLFINLLPCPSCSRMFTETSIDEFVYTEDHSSGYAIRMLEAAGKKVRRLIPESKEG